MPSGHIDAAAGLGEYSSAEDMYLDDHEAKAAVLAVAPFIQSQIVVHWSHSRLKIFREHARAVWQESALYCFFGALYCTTFSSLYCSWMSLLVNLAGTLQYYAALRCSLARVMARWPRHWGWCVILLRFWDTWDFISSAKSLKIHDMSQTECGWRLFVKGFTVYEYSQVISLWTADHHLASWAILKIIVQFYTGLVLVSERFLRYPRPQSYLRWRPQESKTSYLIYLILRLFKTL